MVTCRVCLKEKGAVNRILKSGLTYLGFHYDREVGNGNHSKILCAIQRGFEAMLAGVKL